MVRFGSSAGALSQADRGGMKLAQVLLGADSLSWGARLPATLGYRLPAVPLSHVPAPDESLDIFCFCPHLTAPASAPSPHSRALTLSAFCQACDRSVTLNKDALADRYGWDALLEDIRRRRRCRQCARRADRLMLSHSQAAVPD